MPHVYLLIFIHIFSPHTQHTRTHTSPHATHIHRHTHLHSHIRKHEQKYSQIHTCKACSDNRQYTVSII